MQSLADDILFRTRGFTPGVLGQSETPLDVREILKPRGFVMQSKECVCLRKDDFNRHHTLVTTSKTRRCRHSSRQRSPLSERGPPPPAYSLSRLPCAEGAIYLRSVLTKLTKRFVFNGLLLSRWLVFYKCELAAVFDRKSANVRAVQRFAQGNASLPLT